ncbi:class 3 adenylate cyclase [Actinoplanes lutulentus]|uniref:Class 3 adenylate cyclase n=1 Tax=Actinoplanes lutulentus TaxID=1287878 RepID=A0A327ZDE5_9ACTN|nr:adenylate/guanylate cyclase domain-containing protein [Actinoplanes lutulentus]MBB2942761.1 class 3 adenylate cyclase [Actinoplanes lutulentus]RAK38341.1 class 3 adenylate cyclase [Actinoplanes lutulentus]
MTTITMAGQERRQTVTVLFIDIVGFTTLVDRLDCADVRALQRDYFSTVSAVVRECGGIVEKYVGDAVMAVFGAGDDGFGPDAAACAVRAGLSVQESLRGRLLAGRFPVRTRVGLATGEVIVDPLAAFDGGYAMVSGSVVSTAARLQAYAPHDTVVVCAATREVTDASIAYQELPPVLVPGKSYPLDLFRALQPQAAPLAVAF